MNLILRCSIKIK